MRYKIRSYNQEHTNHNFQNTVHWSTASLYWSSNEQLEQSVCPLWYTDYCSKIRAEQSEFFSSICRTLIQLEHNNYIFFPYDLQNIILQAQASTCARRTLLGGRGSPWTQCGQQFFWTSKQLLMVQKCITASCLLILSVNWRNCHFKAIILTIFF